MNTFPVIIFFIRLNVVSNFIQNPTDNLTYMIPEDQTARLPCNITPPWWEDKVLLVMWYREDIGIPIYTIDSRITSLRDAPHFYTQTLQNRVSLELLEPVSYLIIDPIKRTDAGVYRCRVDFRRGRTINRIISLHVIVPVTSMSILDHNGQEIVDIAGPYNEDSQINITCKATGGYPEPQVTWWKDSVALERTYTLVEDEVVYCTVSIQGLSLVDLMTELTCKASNNNLTRPLYKSISIDLNLKPKELTLSKPGSFVAGSQVSLTCQSKGSKPPAQLTWRKDGVRLNTTNESVESDGRHLKVTTSILNIAPGIDDNGRRLSCLAVNPSLPGITLEEGFLMNVQYQPIVSLVLGSQSDDIREGGLLLFECNVQANPSPEDIGWTFNGDTLIPANMNGLLVNPNTFLIENVTRFHKGDYSCFASNSLGVTQSQPLFLDVRHKPFCKWNESKYLGTTLYKNVELFCEVISPPGHIGFQWVFEKIDGTTINLTSFTSQGAKSWANLVSSSGNDFGTVFCRATNQIGRQDEPCVFYLYPEGPPEAPMNCSINSLNISQDLIQCEPSFNGGAAQTFHLNVYNSVTGDLVQNISSKQPFFHLHSNMSRGPFEYVIFSTNSMGVSSKIGLKASSQPIRAWPDFFGEEASSESLFKISVSFICALTTVLATIFMIFRFCFYQDKGQCSSQPDNPADELDDERLKPVLSQELEESQADIAVHEGDIKGSLISIHEANGIPGCRVEIRSNPSPTLFTSELGKLCSLDSSEPIEAIILQNMEPPVCLVKSNQQQHLIPCNISFLPNQSNVIEPYCCQNFAKINL